MVVGMKTEITERMMAAAREFESAALDAGFIAARATVETNEWTSGNGHVLRVFGYDRKHKSHKWEGGSTWE